MLIGCEPVLGSFKYQAPILCDVPVRFSLYKLVIVTLSYFIVPKFTVFDIVIAKNTYPFVPWARCGLTALSGVPPPGLLLACVFVPSVRGICKAAITVYIYQRYYISFEIAIKSQSPPPVSRYINIKYICFDAIVMSGNASTIGVKLPPHAIVCGVPLSIILITNV